MNNQPTPDTDEAQHEGLLRGNPMPTQVVTANFARKLERERDEARAALERIYQASMVARSLEEDFAEWEKAIESLQGICEKKNFINE